MIRELALVAILGLTACSGSDDNTHPSGSPGDSCQPTSVGAAVCQSNVCATVTCANTVTNETYDVSVCTGTICTNSTCPVGSKCVSFPSSDSYCVPNSACG
jgi:hypothetical protein